jgi:hypothetical protein
MKKKKVVLDSDFGLDADKELEKDLDNRHITISTTTYYLIICIVLLIFSCSFLFAPFYQYFCSSTGLFSPVVEKTIDTTITHHFLYFAPGRYGRGNVILYPMRH